jgi:hypothetical protein
VERDVEDGIWGVVSAVKLGKTEVGRLGMIGKGELQY